MRKKAIIIFIALMLTPIILVGFVSCVAYEAFVRGWNTATLTFDYLRE